MHVIITVNIIWKKLNEKIIENPYNLKCARVVEIQNTKINTFVFMHVPKS